MAGRWPIVVLFICLATILSPSVVYPQTEAVTPKPYASIDGSAVGYSGPGRGKESDLPGDVAVIGLVLPLQGSQAGQGRSMLMAAQLAVDEEAAQPLAGGRRIVLAIGDESGPWGQASSEIVRLILQENAVALITSPNGNVAHQAEQVSNKIGLPILTLSSDPTTTEINIPWIFRVAPSDTAEARIFAHHIYEQRSLRRVLLLAPPDHDGRVATEEFEKAARQLHMPPPERLDITSSGQGVESVTGMMAAHSPDAIVFFGTTSQAQELLPPIQKAQPKVPIYLWQRASQYLTAKVSNPVTVRSEASSSNGGSIWLAISAPAAGTLAARHDFEQRFQARSGAVPSVAAAQMYDAVKMVIAALRVTGANHARLRDRLAAGLVFPGITGDLTFDGFGDSNEGLELLELPGAEGLPKLLAYGAPRIEATLP